MGCPTCSSSESPRPGPGRCSPTSPSTPTSVRATRRRSATSTTSTRSGTAGRYRRWRPTAALHRLDRRAVRLRGDAHVLLRRLPVIEGVRETLGRPSIVLILRNPVDRLWSAYTFQRELGNVTGFSSFEDYLAACRRRRRDGTDLVPGDHLHGLYIGYYADYVPLWLDAFGDDIRVSSPSSSCATRRRRGRSLRLARRRRRAWRPRWTSPPATARTTRAASAPPGWPTP